jgi:hypothetical protein
MTEFRKPQLTTRIPLPGGQDRLKQMILYIAERCATAERFGLIKLNKILWKSDFDAFAARGVPVTGRDYQRLELGPAPKEIPRVYSDLLRDGAIRVEEVDFGDGIVEKRTIPLDRPNLKLFSPEDIAFVDAAIAYYWNMTGTETSDDSHGVAWKTHNNGDPLPYELARLSDQPLSNDALGRLRSRARARGWKTN